VEATFIPSRNKVVTSNKAGKEENINGLSMYKELNKITRDTVMLIAIQTSRTIVGIGKIRIVRTPIRTIGIRR
jgi:hypothetical protein